MVCKILWHHLHSQVSESIVWAFVARFIEHCRISKQFWISHWITTTHFLTALFSLALLYSNVLRCHSHRWNGCVIVVYSLKWYCVTVKEILNYHHHAFHAHFFIEKRINGFDMSDIRVSVNLNYSMCACSRMQGEKSFSENSKSLLCA